MEEHRQAMREFILSHKYSKERVRFTYMLVERQKQFVSALTDNNDDISDPSLRVVLLWRRGEGQVKLEWLQNKWDTGHGQYSEINFFDWIASPEVGA